LTFGFFSFSTIEECFKDVPALCERLQDIREEHSRHSQFVTAMENLKHIFTVPDNVEKTRKWIKEGDFLHARQVHIFIAAGLTVYFMLAS